ncbi:hypothetical protein GCM10028804_31250 [Larkinella terrae]
MVNLKGSLYVGVQDEKLPNLLTKLWQYDFATNSWKAKKDFTGKLTMGLSYFTVGEKLYLGLAQTGGHDLTSTFGVEEYSKTFYEYDPGTDNWKTVDSPPNTAGSGPQIGTGAISFNLQNGGLVLWGTYRTQNSMATFMNEEGGLYNASTGWNRVNITILGSPAFPDIPSNPTEFNLIKYKVMRKNGFGFALNDQVYIGGGDTYRTSMFDPFYGYDELRNNVLSHELYEYTTTKSPDGTSLVVKKIIHTPADYNLTGAHQAFSINNSSYIITSDGQLIRFTPNTNLWEKFATASPLIVGSALNDKAYFINKDNQLVEYISN